MKPNREQVKAKLPKDTVNTPNNRTNKRTGFNTVKKQTKVNKQSIHRENS